VIGNYLCGVQKAMSGEVVPYLDDIQLADLDRPEFLSNRRRQKGNQLDLGDGCPSEYY
jgi:hypothetical protein